MIEMQITNIFFFVVIFRAVEVSRAAAASALECESSEAKESLRLSREIESLARAQRDEERRRRALLEVAAMVKAEDAARAARDNQVFDGLALIASVCVLGLIVCFDASPFLPHILLFLCPQRET